MIQQRKNPDGTLFKGKDRKPRWDARYRGPDGREIKRSFVRKTDGEAWLLSEKAKMQSGEWASPKKRQRPFRTFGDAYMRTLRVRAESTRSIYSSNYRNHVLPRFGDMPIASIRPSDVREWVADMLKDGSSASTVKAAKMLASRIFRQALDDGVIARDPTVRISVESDAKTPGYLTVEQVATLADAIDPRYRALVWVGAFSGLRWGELGGLCRRRVDLPAGVLDVAQQLHEVDGKLWVDEIMKTSKSLGRVSLPRTVTAILAEHMDAYCGPGEDDLVFTSPTGCMLRRSLFRRRVWVPALEAASLDPSLTFHALRHSHASILAAAGVTDLVAQGRMRHATASMTAHYTHLSPGVVDVAAGVLDRVITERKVS